MTKKAYIEAPDIMMTEVQLQGIMAGSKTATVEGDPDPLTPDPDPTPGDASGGLSRRRSVWDDEELIEEEQLY